MTVSLFWTYSQRVSTVTSCLFTAGIAGKSKVSRLFTSGKRAARIRLSTMRWQRSMSSSSASLSRYSRWSTHSAALYRCPVLMPGETMVETRPRFYPPPDL